MFSKIGQIIFENEAVAKTQDFTMGLEIEMQRIDSTGNISQEPYPATIGDQKTNPWITNDFLQTMPEVVTPAAKHALDAMHYLYAINTVLRQALAPGELLWPLSMPPKMPEDKSNIQIAQAGPKKEAYLKEWIKRHGFSAGTPCGAHINLSIDEHIFELIKQKLPHQFDDDVALKNYLYAILAQGFVRYRWLITYLFGASPIAEKNYFKKGKAPKLPMRSIRQSSQGFGTKFVGDYTNVEAYVARIEQGASDGTLISDYEFHGSVRFKGNATLTDLPKTGVEYIELRMLDLDPSTAVGIRTSTVRFIRLLASYFIMHPALNPADVNAVLKNADAINEVVACELPNQKSRYANQALAILNELEHFANKIQLGPEYLEILADFKERVLNPTTTPAARLMSYVKDNSLEEYALRKAAHYQAAAKESLHSFHGFEDGKVLSAKELTQALFKGNWEPAE